jgi:hypothetical protein
MPVKSCSENGNPGFKWGDSGKCYIYEKGNPKSMGEAKRKATIQGLATGEYVNKEDSAELVLEETKTEKSEEKINGYPAATQDISINIRNRQECIDVANYGPMNPMLPNDDYWQARADIYNTSIEEARTSRCSNCAAFVQTTDMIEAIAHGLGGEDEAYAVAKIANLGYCEIFDFKCAGNRTCDAWVTGGPLTDSNMEVEKNYYDIISIARDMLKNKEK